MPILGFTICAKGATSVQAAVARYFEPVANDAQITLRNGEIVVSGQFKTITVYFNEA